MRRATEVYRGSRCALATLALLTGAELPAHAHPTPEPPLPTRQAEAAPCPPPASPASDLWRANTETLAIGSLELRFVPGKPWLGLGPHDGESALSRLYLPHPVSAVLAYEGYLYVIGTGRLASVVDLRAPGQLVLAGSFDISVRSGPPVPVIHQGALLLRSAATIRIYDLREPTRPRLVPAIPAQSAPPAPQPTPTPGPPVPPETAQPAQSVQQPTEAPAEAKPDPLKLPQPAVDDEVPAVHALPNPPQPQLGRKLIMAGVGLFTAGFMLSAVLPVAFDNDRTGAIPVVGAFWVGGSVLSGSSGGPCNDGFCSLGKFLTNTGGVGMLIFGAAQVAGLATLIAGGVIYRSASNSASRVSLLPYGGPGGGGLVFSLKL